jgi:hypothetical protein
VKKDRPPLPFLPVLAEDLADGPYAPRRELSFTLPHSPVALPPRAPESRRAA